MTNKEKLIKIAFVGTSCTGKTTLVDNYRDNPNVLVVDEAARIFFTQNPGIAERFSVDTQGKVQALALKNEQAAHQSGARLILCDRSVIDAVVYVRSQGDKKGAEKLLNRVRFWLPTYHKFLLLDPADIPYKTDDIRQEDETTRQNFHNAFLEFFSETGLPFELLSGKLEKRVKRIEEIIKL